MTIGLSNHSKQSQKYVETQIIESKEVTECHNITGSNEYLLRVETESLSSYYKQFHSNVLGEISQANSIGTLVVMDTPKDERT